MNELKRLKWAQNQSFQIKWMFFPNLSSVFLKVYVDFTWNAVTGYCSYCSFIRGESSRQYLENKSTLLLHQALNDLQWSLFITSYSMTTLSVS